MAVQDQPTDEAADLGQDLPTGRVRRVRCDARGSVRSTCVVDWLPVSGAAERTVLEVRARPDGCWDARPRPVLRSRYDATIASYAEHPLNVLSSVRPGC